MTKPHIAGHSSAPSVTGFSKKPARGATVKKYYITTGPNQSSGRISAKLVFFVQLNIAISIAF